MPVILPAGIDVSIPPVAVPPLDPALGVGQGIAADDVFGRAVVKDGVEVDLGVVGLAHQVVVDEDLIPGNPAGSVGGGSGITVLTSATTVFVRSSKKNDTSPLTALCPVVVRTQSATAC